MLAVLVPLFWLLAAVAFFLQDETSGPRIRRAVIVASVITAAMVVIACEVLSPFQAFGRRGLALFWTLAVIGLGAVAALQFHRCRRGDACRPALPRFGWSERILLVAVFAILAAVASAALAAPPNNQDSMAYHMARVAHWMANSSVAFYPTHILRQDAMSPLAEWGIAHLQILSGGDRFANLVQFASMLGSLALASLIAKRLGASQGEEILAVVIAATIPMGILQASSTQNDYVAAFWLTCLVASLFELRQQSSRVWVACSGAALGFAILTKSLAGVFALPLLVWSAVTNARRDWRRGLRAGLAIAVVGMVINLGHWSRNWDAFGSLNGPYADANRHDLNLLMEDHSFPAIASNLLRNSALQLNYPSERLRPWTEGVMRELHGVLPIAIDDPRTTWQGASFALPYYFRHEDGAGNPLHFLLGICAFGLSLLRAPLRRQLALVGYGGSLAAAWLLFNITLKWQPWHARLLLPVAVLATPFIARVVSQSLGRVVTLGVAGLLG